MPVSVAKSTAAAHEVRREDQSLLQSTAKSQWASASVSRLEGTSKGTANHRRTRRQVSTAGPLLDCPSQNQPGRIHQVQVEPTPYSTL